MLLAMQGAFLMPKTNRWVREVKTISTHPPEGLFTKDPKTIECLMASKRIRLKGIGSAIRMVQFFINRAGRNLPGRALTSLGKSQRNVAGPARSGTKVQIQTGKEQA